MTQTFDDEYYPSKISIELAPIELYAITGFFGEILDRKGDDELSTTARFVVESVYGKAVKALGLEEDNE